MAPLKKRKLDKEDAKMESNIVFIGFLDSSHQKYKAQW